MVRKRGERLWESAIRIETSVVKVGLVKFVFHNRASWILAQN
jgi:hypothetical protein